MASRLPRRLEHDYADVLTGIFDLMLGAGIDARDLEQTCIASLNRADARARSGSMDETGGLMTAALVLDAWHRDRRYLSTTGVPKAVPLLGAAPSVEAMVRAQRPRKSPAEIARRLKTLRLIVPSGKQRYKPSSDVAVISVQDPLVLQHTARALSALLETVGRNVHRTNGVSPLIERHAEVPDLPRKHIEAFQKFTQVQGRTFLRTVNDWLESRRAKRSVHDGPTSTVRAGVHTYAYFASKRRGSQPDRRSSRNHGARL
jgi:hypothetical protein